MLLLHYFKTWIHLSTVMCLLCVWLKSCKLSCNSGQFNKDNGDKTQTLSFFFFCRQSLFVNKIFPCKETVLIYFRVDLKFVHLWQFTLNFHQFYTSMFCLFWFANQLGHPIVSFIKSCEFHGWWWRLEIITLFAKESGCYLCCDQNPATTPMGETLPNICAQ